MKKSLAIFGATMAMAMTAMPSSASAAVEVTCTTSTGSTNLNGIGGGSSSCDTFGGGDVPTSNWRRSSTAPIGSGTEFWFRTVTNSTSVGDNNPLASIDVSNNRISIQVLGIRTIASTILTFTSSQPFTGVTNATGIFARPGVLSLSGNTIRMNFSNVSLGSTETLSAGSFNFTPAVPEPGTWLLMILGLGAVGFAMRRRQAAAVRYQFA